MINSKVHIEWARILNYAPVLLLITLITVFVAVDDRIITITNLMQVLVQSAPIAILAIGAMVVLVSGGIDLSVGYGVGLCAVITGIVFANGGTLFEATFWTVLTGVLIGFINGFFVGVLKIPPFIVTLGSMTVIQGITLLIAMGEVLIISNPSLKAIGIGFTGPVPNLLLATAVLLLIATVIIKQTVFGLRTYALGSNEEATRFSGVPLARQQILIYIFSGICTAFTAMLLVSRVSIVSPNIGGINLMLDAITATVIGGTSIFGGKGTITGTLVGSVIISLISHALTIFGISASSLDFFKGAIIIFALTIDSAIRAAQKRLGSKKDSV